MKKMKKLFNNKSIGQLNFLRILFATFLLLLFILIAIYNSYSQYKDDIKLIEEKYIISQKRVIKKEVEKFVNFIKYKDSKNKNISISELQKEVIDIIENIQPKDDGTEYTFIYSLDGVNISDPILKSNIGKNLIDFKDINGKKVIKELINVSKKDEGGYVRYVWNKPTTNKPSPKISYAIAYKPWGWMIGRGVYLDNINIVLKNKKEQYYNHILKYLKQVLFLSLSLFVIWNIIYRYIILTLKSDVELITSSSNLEYIKVENILFKEFKKIAKHINIVNSNLKDLNKNLELKVEVRTKELKESKQYVVDILNQQDKFIKDAIHEINTPLSIIISNIDLFKLKFKSNKYLTNIEAGSKIIHNIYNDLEFMIKKDRIEYIKTNINLSNFIRDRIEFFKQVAIGNNLEFNISIENDLYINFNTTKLQRICDNTISNAIKYSYQNKKINILLYKKLGNIILEVENEGKNIENIEKLFDRFYRENSTRGGFGIGLNIIKEICDENNVAIEITSENDIITYKYIFK